ncbi:MAG: flagellar basal body P-ring formation protein FlgA [Nitrospirae bacterium]|nr:flagellar basal body P-ring formation protein FlgA [Candidatus Manganitrophaceae bacterium]
MRNVFPAVLLLIVTVIGVDTADAAERQAKLTPEGRVGAAIQRYVAGYLGSKEEEIRVRLLREPEGEWAAGEILEVKEGSRGGLLGRVVFLVSARTNGKPAGYQWITAEVEMIRSAVVSVRSLRRSQVIAPGDLEVRSVGVVRAGEPYVVDPEVLIGKRLVRSIGPGVPISLEMVEATPLIHPGDRVTLLVEAAGLRIATVGRAKEEGFVGRSMAIVNLDSQKTIYGEVVDASTVRVILPE